MKTKTPDELLQELHDLMSHHEIKIELRGMIGDVNGSVELWENRAWCGIASVFGEDDPVIALTELLREVNDALGRGEHR